MAHFNVPEDVPPGSQKGTLKANGTHRPQRQNGSLKGPWNQKNRDGGVPAVKEDTAKVLEMYLKRRSKSLNNAVLKLKDGENRTASLSRDGYKRDSKKEPSRKRSSLDKAENIMRSPSTKIIRTPSAVQGHSKEEGSERQERPQTLASKRTRAERAQRRSNNLIRLDSTTPGHVKRDVDTSFPVLPAALLADDLVMDGGPDRGASGGREGADRKVKDSWTESGDGSDIPFEKRNQAEQEEYFKRIADRLAMIGDQELADYEFNDGAAGAAGGQQRPNFRSQADFLNSMAMDVIKKATYQSFCSAIESIIGQDVGMWQLAVVFKFTEVAVGAADSMGKHASSIKDNSIRFISDRFAVWLASQGGWGSVVTSDDSDSLHEESVVD